MRHALLSVSWKVVPDVPHNSTTERHSFDRNSQRREKNATGTALFTSTTHAPDTMARRDRSISPDVPNKRVRPHRSSRSPSPTRRSSQRPPRSRYDDDRDRERPRDRDRDRDRDGYRDRDRHRDDRFRDDKRRDGYRDDRRDDRDRRRSRSRDRRDRPPPPTTNAPTPAPLEKGADSATPPVEDEKLKAKKAKLEAWKKEREAKKALGEAKAKAMALAGKTAPGMYLSRPVSICTISQHLIFLLQTMLLRPRVGS